MREVTKTKIRVKVLLLLCEETKSFLTLLQSRQPMIHQLLFLAQNMFNGVANLVVKAACIPSVPKKIPNLDLTNSDNLLSSRNCGFLACCAEDVASLESEERREIRKELQASTVAMLRYLQKNLPWDKELYEHVSFLDPLKRSTTEVQKFGVSVAKHLRRFTETQLIKLGVQLNQYQALTQDQVPVYRRKDRVDHWWVLMFSKLEEINGEQAKELEVLVKLTCTLAHGNAFLERGMGLTKRLVHGRESMGDITVKAQKVVSEVINRSGGAVKVPITNELINSVKLSSMRYNEDLRKLKEADEKTAKNAAEEAKALELKKLEEDNKMKWSEKKKSLEDEIKAGSEFINLQEDIQKRSTERSLKLTSADGIKMAIRTTQYAREAAVEKGKVLAELQRKLLTHMGKKPKK